MATEEFVREPCPMRIFDDLGGAFTMGVIGGGIFHSISGFRNSAKGARMVGMSRNALLRAPLTGGQFAAWGGTFAVVDCSMMAIRGKEDYLNSITAGAVTGGVLMVRQGPMAMGTSAVVGGVLLALIEGVGVMLNRWQASMFDPTAPQPQMEDPSALGAAPAQPAGMFGGGPQAFFGGQAMPETLSTAPTPGMEEPKGDLDINMGMTADPNTLAATLNQSKETTQGGGWSSWLNWS